MPQKSMQKKAPCSWSADADAGQQADGMTGRQKLGYRLKQLPPCIVMPSSSCPLRHKWEEEQ